MKYAVLVSWTHVCCDSIIVEADTEEAALQAAIEEARRKVNSDDTMTDIENRFDAEVLRSLIPAGSPVQYPKPTVAMRKVEGGVCMEDRPGDHGRVHLCGNPLPCHYHRG